MIPIGDEPRHNDRIAVVMSALVLTNILVYGLTTAQADTLDDKVDLYWNWGFRPADPSPMTFVSSLFLHASPVHLIGNMLFLWIFGVNVEWCLGRVGFLAVYLLSGIAGDAATWVADPSSEMPAVGASGAISGVLGVYLIAFPKYRVKLLFWMFHVAVFSVPAWSIIGFWFVVNDLWPLVQSTAVGDGIGHMAHLGGFAFGALSAFAIRRWTRRLERA